MPRRKSATATTPDILVHLPAEHRAALEGQIMGSALVGVITGARNIAALFDALTAHPLWSHLGRLPASSLTGSPVASPVAMAASVKRKPGRPKKDAHAVAAPAATATTEGTAKTARKGKKLVRRSPEQKRATEEKLLAFIARNPGLKSEEIVKEIGGDAKVFKSGLADLRAAKKVVTKGARRAMTYAVA
jgi:hypothetical protein